MTDSRAEDAPILDESTAQDERQHFLVMLGETAASAQLAGFPLDVKLAAGLTVTGVPGSIDPLADGRLQLGDQSVEARDVVAYTVRAPGPV